MGRKKSKGWKGQGTKYHLNVKTNALLARAATEVQISKLSQLDRKIRWQFIFSFGTIEKRGDDSY